MSKLKIMDEDGCLTEKSKEMIYKHTEILECACPQHLLKVLKSINDFQEYETSCIIKYPKDEAIHSWLLEESMELERKTTEILVELMKKENVIDDDYFFCQPPSNTPG